MNRLERKAFDLFHIKPYCWNKYINDENINQSHGRDGLKELHKYLFLVYKIIQFTKKLEDYIINVLVYKNNSGKLGHEVYRKNKY